MRYSMQCKTNQSQTKTNDGETHEIHEMSLIGN